MSLTISREALAQIRAEAHVASPAECCGLLLGNRQGGLVEVVLPARNIAAEPERHFEIDPAVLLAAHRAARDGGGSDLIGHYHSHPRGPASPSRTDAEMAQGAGEIWLILGSDGQAGAWRAIKNGAAVAVFSSLALLVVEQSFLAPPLSSGQ